MGDNNIMLHLNGITKTYAKGARPAVDALDLHVRRGEIFGFLGPNGAGKTTTIKMLCGILRPDSGGITIGGVDLASDPIAAKRNFCYVPDVHDTYDRLTGQEYLNFVADVYGVPTDERRARAQKYLEMFEIAHAAGDRINTYSHGMKQKLLIAAALLPNPPLWVLDEPMTGLDPKSSALLKDEMHAHTAAGNTVFFSTHVLEVAEKLCDRIGIIRDGKLIAVGTLDELRGGSDESLESVFLELTEDVE